jgi:gliding motility-associated-like protein
MWAQCTTQNITGNLIPPNGATLSGTYNILGYFYLPAGDTIWVQDYDINGCGTLEIHADSINMAGVIMANGAGMSGGTGGLGGICVDSLYFQDCSLAGQCLGISAVGGGNGGGDGLSPATGGGKGASNATAGTGRKNQCNITSDRIGRAGGGGGAGGGRGGYYGGVGSGAGGNTAGGIIPQISANTFDNQCVPAASTPFAGGSIGTSAATSTVYGTSNGIDIDLGSGGGGGGGGGRGFYPATKGGDGGDGGGLVKLISNNALILTGAINANGEDGKAGGKGGDGGESSNCCQDQCHQTWDHTYIGAGGGGSGSGAGSGGGIFIQASGFISVTGTLSAKGGVGGAGGAGGLGGSWSYQEPAFICSSSAGLLTTTTIAAANAGKTGGMGGGGRIKIFYNNCIAATNVAPTTSVLAGGTGATNGTFFKGGTQQFALGTISSSPSPQNICTGGDPSPLTYTPASTGYSPTYQWQFQTNCAGVWANIAGATAATYDPPAGITQGGCFRLKVTFGTCTGFANDTLQILVGANPGFTPQIIPAGTVTQCAGNPVSLDVQNPLPAGTTIQWYQNGQPISAANGGNSLPLNATTSGNYYLSAVNGGSCTVTSNTTILNISASSTVNVSVSGNTTFCNGQSVTLSAPSAVGSVYSWYDGTSLMGTGANLVATVSGNYAVTVTDINNCTASSSATNVIVNPMPIAGAAALGATTFCNGQSVDLTGTGNGNFQWQLNGANISTTNPLTVTSTGNYQLIVTNAFNCADTSSIIPITVNPSPTANINASSATTFCNGSSVALTATGGGTYQWTQNSFNFSNTNPLIVSTSGNYTVIVTNNFNCKDTAAVVPVTVNPSPNAVINASGATTFCNGQNLSLTASGGTSYQWLLNNANFSTNNPVTVTNSGSYTVIATNSFNCTGLSSATLITVNPTPIANLTVSGATTFCQGQSVTLTASGNGNVQWQQNGANITAPNPLVVNATSDYQVIVTNNFSCADTSNLISVVVNTTPIASVNVSGVTTFCQGDSVILTGSGGTSYQWQQNGVNFSVINPLTISNSGNYTLIVSNGFNCNDTSNITSITVNTTPTAGISVSPLTFCSGDIVTLTASGTGNYQWAAPLNTQTQVTQVNTALFPNNSEYCLTVTDAISACFDTACVHLNAAPAATATIAALGATTFCQGSSVNLQASGGTTYQWFLDNVPILGATAAAYNATQAGNYSVSVANAANCADTSSIITVVVENLPVPNLTILPSLSVCLGDTITITATGGDIYLWNVPIGAQAGSGNIYEATVSGPYSLTVTNANGSCPVSISPFALNFTQLPVPNITPLGSTTICDGSSVILDGGNFNNYQWYFNGAAVFGAGTNPHTVTDAGVYYVVVTDATGCQGTSAPITITMNPAPTPVISGDSSFCEGSAGALLQTQNYSTYQWLLNGVVLSNPNATSNPFSANIGGDYTVEVTDANGCAGVSPSFSVQSSFNPNAVVSPPGPLVLCEGAKTILNANINFQYQWFWNNAPIGTNMGALTITDSGTYTLIVTNLAGCKDTAKVRVNFSPLPVAQITVNNTIDPCVLNANLSASGGNILSWYKDGQVIPNTMGVPSINVSGAGYYTVEVENPCGKDVSEAIALVSSRVKADFSFSPTDIYMGSPVRFNENTKDAVSILWQFGDGTSAVEWNPTHQFAQADTYQVALIAFDVNGCTDTLIVPIIVKALGNVYIPTAFSPNADGYNDVFQAFGTDIESFRLILTDRWGRNSLELNDLSQVWDGTVNGKPAPEGVYYYRYEAVLVTGQVTKGGGNITLIR